MKELKEKQVKSERLYKGTLLGLRRDTVELPNGKQSTREVVEHPGAVAVIAITQDKEMVFVRQFRQPTGEVLLEVPAGVPLTGEKGEDAARRELAEETGYNAKIVRKIWEGYASPGYSDELIKFYLALEMNLMQTKPDEDEFVEVELIDVEACLELLKTGKIRDNKTMIGVMIAELFLKGEI
ncbi:MAG: NUDIX hydrolase [Candidatus Margulisbacteria bacterium]|nr:NUDIX hydrolase [Candidatus Margulisiibacteriota bacterium]